ncbi:hypothetical protein Patl1_07644 [Pistacia atlantica]|uniref:Uncharacterized protein n=1 Tax=Pistacia atlantica TaxID=434234 RepID=A0ACC1AKP1_9ROSI|nr:hypothetical protein Patl1_07644 [Pistacia atlantica]
MTLSPKQTCSVPKRCPLHCPPQLLSNFLMALPRGTARIWRVIGGLDTSFLPVRHIISLSTNFHNSCINLLLCFKQRQRDFYDI